MGCPRFCCRLSRITPCFLPTARWIFVEAKGSSSFAVFLIGWTDPCCDAKTQKIYCVSKGWCFSDQSNDKLSICLCKMFIISLAGLLSPQSRWGQIFLRAPKNWKVSMWCLAPQVSPGTKPHLTWHDAQNGVNPLVLFARFLNKQFLLFNLSVWSNFVKNLSFKM